MNEQALFQSTCWLLDLWRDAQAGGKKCFLLKNISLLDFFFCLSVWRQMITQPTVLHLLQQNSQMLSAQLLPLKAQFRGRLHHPIRILPFWGRLRRLVQRACRLFHLPAKERNGRGGRREEGSCSKWCEMSRGEKVTLPKSMRRASVADKLSLLVSFPSLAVICNSSEAQRGLRIISGWHLPSQETPFF